MDNNYNLRPSIPNKLLNSDGSITDMFGNPVSNPVDEYVKKLAIVNKFLNADGSYSTLQELLAEGIDTTIFITVDTLPQEGIPNKIYLVPNGEGDFDEYIWINNSWEAVGMLEFDINNFYTKTQTDSNFLKKDNTTEYTPTGNYNPATKQYVDNAITTNITNMLGGSY